MTDLKITTWNIEKMGALLADNDARDVRRRAAVAEQIRRIDADVLCLVEAPGDLAALRAWVDHPDGLGGAYTVPTVPGTDAALAAAPGDPRAALADLYAMHGNRVSGNQWVWFLVRASVAAAATQCELQDPAIWQRLTDGASWEVNFWGDMSARRHRHWRHPQVLVLELNGRRLEFIGVHMKSKINRRRVRDAEGNLSAEYVVEALEARVKLATEAADVRRYLDARFAQETHPAILVLGDANDGPGKRYFERRYLFFDLISNVQGDVFFARRFLNHCLFDFADELRYSTRFRDPVEPEQQMQLLDHILFTQSLVGRNRSPRIAAGSGLVEHRAHELVNATLHGDTTSDHRPVSVTLSAA